MAEKPKHNLRDLKAEIFQGIFDLETLKINPTTHKVYADVSGTPGFVDDTHQTSFTATIGIYNKIDPIAPMDIDVPQGTDGAFFGIRFENNSTTNLVQVFCFSDESIDDFIVSPLDQTEDISRVISTSLVPGQKQERGTVMGWVYDISDYRWVLVNYLKGKDVSL